MVARKDGRSSARGTQEFLRINSIERWLGGESPQNIIKTTGLCPTTIYKWIDTYNLGGMESLASTKAGTPWERSTFTEIRLRLFKVAGRLKVMKTKVRLHLATALEASHRVIWERCAGLAGQ